jgi:antitoxin component YwqK of YwqJK toxin-antitoxin module
MKILCKKLLPLFVMVTSIACSDDAPADEVKVPLLSKVMRDDKLEIEFKYNADRHIEQSLLYDLSTGAVESDSRFKYDQNGILQTVTNVDTDGNPTTEWRYTWNEEKKILSCDLVKLFDPEDGAVIARYKYTFGKSGNLQKRSWFDPESDSEESFAEYSYHRNGNLQSEVYYWIEDGLPEEVYEITYSPAGEILPESIRNAGGHPVNTTLPLLSADLILRN